MKKCNCKKCIHGKQIFWGYSKEVRCAEYGTMPIPKYCDHYKTIQQHNVEQVVKKLEELIEWTL